MEKTDDQLLRDVMSAQKERIDHHDEEIKLITAEYHRMQDSNEEWIKRQESVIARLEDVNRKLQERVQQLELRLRELVSQLGTDRDQQQTGQAS